MIENNGLRFERTEFSQGWAIYNFVTLSESVNLFEI